MAKPCVLMSQVAKGLVIVIFSSIHAMSCGRHKTGVLLVVQELLPALRSLEEEEDDIKGIRLRWAYCFFMLRTGSHPDHIITVSDFLDRVRKERMRIL